MSTASEAAPAAVHETQASICDWAKSTFGATGSDLRVAARANEEMAELVRAVTAEASIFDILEEAADVLIVLARIGERLGVKLTFGPDFTDSYGNSHRLLWSERPLELPQAAAVANTRMARLIEALAFGQKDPLWLINLWSSVLELVMALGADPQRVVDAKMAKNRKRVWKRDGTGHGYHVRDKVNGAP